MRGGVQDSSLLHCRLAKREYPPNFNDRLRWLAPSQRRLWKNNPSGRSWPDPAIGGRPWLQPLVKIAEFVTGGNVAQTSQASPGQLRSPSRRRKSLDDRRLSVVKPPNGKHVEPPRSANLTSTVRSKLAALCGHRFQILVGLLDVVIPEHRPQVTMLSP